MSNAMWKGQAVEVVSTKGGWSTVIVADGATRKVRNSQLNQEGAAMAKQSKKAKGKTNGKAKGKQASKAERGTRRVGESVFSRFDAYHKGTSNSGNVSYDNNDALARELRGLAIEDLYKVAAERLGETERSLKQRYGKLNSGMQRMNLGNRMRAALRNAE